MMFTRKMNARITVFKKEGGQNEDGEVVGSIRKDVFSCWAEVAKTSIRDFQVKSIAKDGVDGLLNNRDTKKFLIRYMPNPPFDNSMFVEFNGLEYKITNIEIDYSSKDMIMIGGERVT